jgi:hypothetical protein
MGKNAETSGGSGNSQKALKIKPIVVGFLAPGNYFLLGDSFVEDFYFVILVLSGRIVNYVMDE